MQKHIHGGDVYRCHPKVDFSANINPLGVPEGVLAAVRGCGRELACYPDVECAALRRALAEKMGVPEDALIFGNGAAELIFAAVRAQSPKKALLVSPGFAEYEQALAAAGCEIVFYELKKENGFQVLEDWLDCLTKDIEIAFLCSPNNPTGAALPADFLERAAKRCGETGTRLVLDECFNGFLDEPEACSMKGRLSAYPNLFILNAFTKLYAMPGLRLGYGLCADRAFLEKMEQNLQPWNVSVPAQRAGEAALLEDAYVKEAGALVRTERLYLTEALRLAGLTVYEPAANFLFFEGPPGLAGRLLKKGYLIRDCANYRGLRPGYYRIAVRLPEENRLFAAALCEVLNEMREEGEY